VSKGKAKAKAKGEGSDVIIGISKNRRATHDYAISERFEAGLVLTGSEVKSCRQGKVQLNDAYVMVDRKGAELLNAHISEYNHANQFNHIPDRGRRLLLRENELDKLRVRILERGLSAIPLQMYFKNGWAKVEIGVGKGKTHEDRRHDIKSREAKREMDRVLRSRR